MNGLQIRERIKTILQEGIASSGGCDDLPDCNHENCQFAPRLSVHDSKGNTIHRKKGSRLHVNELCKELFHAASEVDGHVQRLDTVYSRLMSFSVSPRDDQMVLYIAQKTHDFLRRLPKRPLGLPGSSKLPNPYFDAEPDGDEDIPYSRPAQTSLMWPRLKVALFYSTNVLRLVLFRTIYTQEGGDGSEEKNLVDLTADLLQKCSELEKARYGGDNQAALNTWYIVRCFLWASWQRSQMLYFYRTLCLQLEKGIDPGFGSLTVLRSTLVAPDLTIQHFSDMVAFEGKATYMCSWAFNILRADGIAIGSDFRLLHHRFKQLFGSRAGRCDEESQDSCDGDQLGNCMRSLASVDNQSMHDQSCTNKCHSLTWDEKSYRSVSGGRAVDVSSYDSEGPDTQKLRYVTASNKTLAVSHAWAHGQGGDPGSGLNSCLYERYVKLARAHQCDSFFIDTACIPEPCDLRHEAISHINETFRRSKLTLIVDKDLLTVDVENLTIELQESLLAAVLVSDWNVRAWTLLEAMKGRRNIHVLCKNARTVSCSELIHAIANTGKVDIAIFALLAPHLLSRNAALDAQDEIGMTDPSVETAGMLLSYRPASRRGDELAIWSLMINDTNAAAGNAQEFWHRRRGTTVATGFLVSSANRLKQKGLTWAPNTPYAAPKNNSMPQNGSENPKVLHKFFRAFEGNESELAEITEHGIFADWFIYEFQTGFQAYVKRKYQRLRGCCGSKSNRNQILATKLRRAVRFFRRRRSGSRFVEEDQDDNEASSSERLLNHIQLHHLTKYRYGILAQPVSTRNNEPWSMHKHIADYSGGVKGDLMVVLGSNKSHSMSYNCRKPHLLHNWEWKGVCEWPTSVGLPEFKRRKVWIA